jgi:hypothetical protein
VAALTILWNRFSSYFAKPNNEMNNADCGRSNEEISTDEEMSINDDPCLYLCTACNKEIPVKYYNCERQMCRCCYEISLGGEKRCAMRRNERYHFIW